MELCHQAASQTTRQNMRVVTFIYLRILRGGREFRDCGGTIDGSGWCFLESGPLGEEPCSWSWLTRSGVGKGRASESLGPECGEKGEVGRQRVRNSERSSRAWRGEPVWGRLTFTGNSVQP